MSEAQYQHALKLLSGSGEPMSPERGAAELEAAAQAGHAEAAARMAVVAGAGFGCPQDWEASLHWLVLAADAGDAGARAQLAMLANAPGASGDWAALRKHINVGAWIAPRPAGLAFSTPRIGLALGFLEHEMCDWMIARAAPMQTTARVYDPATGAPIVHDKRSNTLALFTILELDVPMLMIKARIAATIRAPVQCLERFNVFHYSVGQRFSRHVDFLDPAVPQFAADIARFGQRVATFLVYLNGGFEGGETTFLALGESVKGAKGDAVFFFNIDAQGQPDRMTVHEGSPPTAGEKWLLSQFIRDRAQLPG